MGAPRYLFVYIWLLLGAVVATDARVQGFGVLFPTPITSEELEEYAGILSLTPEQSQALEDAFQEYQQACSAIGQDDIPRFSVDRKAAMRDPQKQFDIRVQRKYHRRGLAIRARIAALDNRFLEQLDSQLTEDQQAIMPHVRNLRERERHHWSIVRSGEVRLEPAIDLTRLIGTIDLTVADHKALAPVIQDYDRALTASIQRYASAKIEMIFIYQDAQEHEDRRRKMVEQGIRVLELNRTWLATMASVLPPQTAAELKDTYRKKVYHGIYPDLENAHRKFDAALDMQQLSDDQKIMITAQREAYIEEHARLTEQIIAMLKDIRLLPEYWMAKRTSLVEPLEGLNDLHTLMDRRKKLNSEAVETLAEFFGDGVLRSIRIAAAERYGPREEVRLPKRMPRMMRIQLANTKLRSPPTGGSPMLAMFFVQRYPPINTQLIQQLAETLGLTDSQLDIVLTLHEQYVIDFMSQRNAIPEEITYGEQFLWARGEDDSFHPPTTAEIRDLHEAKLRAISSLEELDDRFFFDELPSIVQTPKQLAIIATARRARLRSVYLRRSGSRLNLPGYFLGGESKLYELDLLSLLESIEPSEEDAEQFNTIRDSYDVTSADLARERFVAVHDCKLLADQMLVETFRDGDEYYEFSLIGDSDLARQFSGACKRLASAEERYYDLNLSTPKQLMELLKPDVARELEDRFREAAYPDIIEDPQAMHEQLETALHNPVLGERQQQAIADLRDEYYPEYRLLIDRLVATQRDPRDTGYYRIADGQISLNFNSKYGQVRQEVKALKFERKEFNASIKRRLALILETHDHHKQ